LANVCYHAFTQVKSFIWIISYFRTKQRRPNTCYHSCQSIEQHAWV
jgi:hypothetical protein